MARIKRALVSASDKKGLVEFCRGLAGMGVELISTGGTAKALSAAGIKAVEVSSWTGFPEMMGGRVKTLHPSIHGGILARRDVSTDMEEAAAQDIKPIDMVVVNLYPFEKTVSDPGVAIEEAVEQIDIGGPTMLRAAAKNYRHVAAVVNPVRYDSLLSEMRSAGGCLSDDTLRCLALEVFEHTAFYDAAVARFLRGRWEADEPFPQELSMGFRLLARLRYGENPSQRAAFYCDPFFRGSSIARATQHGGKELSYNNIMDLDAALACASEFDEPAVCIVKHATPCGVAAAEKLEAAYADALACDLPSAFGCVIALNRPADLATAKLIGSTEFVEAVVAPGYEPEALKLLLHKKNRRILEIPPLAGGRAPHLVPRCVAGGLLLQDADVADPADEEMRVVTKRRPTSEEMRAMAFAWRAVKHVKSNAILLASGTHSVGIGAGQMSRVDAVRVAVEKAGRQAKGAVLASDAFFPMPDGVEVAARAGVTAVVQPGGSKGDDEVVAAADAAGMAMVFTGSRHFKH